MLLLDLSTRHVFTEVVFLWKSSVFHFRTFTARLSHVFVFFFCDLHEFVIVKTRRKDKKKNTKIVVSLNIFFMLSFGNLYFATKFNFDV